MRVTAVVYKPSLFRPGVRIMGVYDLIRRTYYSGFEFKLINKDTIEYLPPIDFNKDYGVKEYINIKDTSVFIVIPEAMADIFTDLTQIVTFDISAINVSVIKGDRDISAIIDEALIKMSINAENRKV